MDFYVHGHMLSKHLPYFSRSSSCIVEKATIISSKDILGQLRRISHQFLFKIYRSQWSRHATKRKQNIFRGRGLAAMFNYLFEY